MRLKNSPGEWLHGGENRQANVFVALLKIALLALASWFGPEPAYARDDEAREAAIDIAVRIDVLGEVTRSGTGVILGWDAQRVYIATAKHVLWGSPRASDFPRRIDVSLRGVPGLPLAGVPHCFAEGMDVAIISIDGSLAAEVDLSKNDKTSDVAPTDTCLLHDFKWSPPSFVESISVSIAKGNELRDDGGPNYSIASCDRHRCTLIASFTLQKQDEAFVLKGVGVDAQFSGAPIFNAKWELIGIALRVSDNGDKNTVYFASSDQLTGLYQGTLPTRTFAQKRASDDRAAVVVAAGWPVGTHNIALSTGIAIDGYAKKLCMMAWMNTQVTLAKNAERVDLDEAVSLLYGVRSKPRPWGHIALCTGLTLSIGVHDLTGTQTKFARAAAWSSIVRIRTSRFNGGLIFSWVFPHDEPDQFLLSLAVDAWRFGPRK